MAEFDVKKIDQFDHQKHHVIEASAGTGKTYSITKIVRHLIEKGVSIEKILLVTYTEKAAGELKDRIRKELLKSGADKNLCNVDKATIGTIHSFCTTILSEYAISAKKPTERALINEGEVKDFIKRYIRRGSIFNYICLYKKNKNGEDIEEKLVEKFSKYLGKYYLDKNLQKCPGVISFDAENVRGFEIFINEYIEAYTKNEDIRKISKVKTAIENIQLSNYQKKNEALEIINAEDNKFLKGFEFTTKSARVDLDARIALELITSISKTIKKFEKKLTIKDNEWYINFLVYKFIDDVYKSWQLEKDSLSKQTFNDMIRDVREEVVNEGKLLDCIRNKYTYAIIDEFQDTNQLQWDIFRTAFVEDEKKEHFLYVVGDPKQSIYAFQGADVDVYNQAKEVIETKGGEISELKKNYRSTEEMINAVGDFFEMEWEQASENQDESPQKIKALDNETFSRSGVGDNCHFSVSYNGEDIAPFWITKERVDEYEYADIVCKEIIDCCSKEIGSDKTNLRIVDKVKENIFEERNVSFKDFAVLGKTHSELQAIQHAFEKYGIPYRQYKENTLLTGKECAEWCALLDAINTPDFSGNNRMLLRKALITDFFGIRLDDVQDEKYDKDSTKEVSMFIAWKQIAEEHNWEELISKIESDTELIKKLGALNDLKTLTVMKQIGEYCVDTLSKTNSLEMLIKNLRMHLNYESSSDDDQDSSLIARGTEFDCVQLMTIHASKGLEFPVVISVAGFKAKNNKLVSAYSYHDNGQRYLTFDSSKAVIEETAELKRLYYVAYTRAKFILMLPTYEKDGINACVRDLIEHYKECHKEACNNGSPEKYPYKELTKEDVDVNALKSQVKAILQSEKHSITSEDGTKETQITAIEKLRENLPNQKSYKHAYSSLSHSKKDEKMGDNGAKPSQGEDQKKEIGLERFDPNPIRIPCTYEPKATPLEFAPDFPAGTGLGNALHKIFELIDYVDEKTASEQLIEDCFKKEGLKWSKDWYTNIKEMVHRVVNAKLPKIQGANAVEGEDFYLKDLLFADRKNEVEFNFNKQDQLFKNYFNGFIDLIFRYEVNDHYVYGILDWKSDRLNDEFTAYNEQESLQKHVDELYAIQRVLYAYCLINWLSEITSKTPETVFKENFGGVYYVFLRGCNENTGNGIYAQTWDSFETLKERYDQIVKEKVEKEEPKEK